MRRAREKHDALRIEVTQPWLLGKSSKRLSMMRKEATLHE